LAALDAEDLPRVGYQRLRFVVGPRARDGRTGRGSWGDSAASKAVEAPPPAWSCGTGWLRRVGVLVGCHEQIVDPCKVDDAADGW
jgi:hypothetical protein